MALHFFHTPDGALTLYSHRHNSAIHAAVQPANTTEASGETYGTVIPPQHSGKAMLVLQPFAEESNRCRYMWPELAAQLSDIDTFVLDGWGCGDSAGDFSDASIGRWRSHLLLLIQQLQQQGYRELRFLAVRFGALQLLDLLSFGPLPLPVSQVLLWQPQLQSQTFLTQWLRLKQANLLSNPATDSPKALRAQLLQGTSVDIAGYAMTAALYHDIAQLQPRLAPCYRALRVDCIYSQLPPATVVVNTPSSDERSHAQQAAHKEASKSVNGPLTNTAESHSTHTAGAAPLSAALVSSLAEFNAYLATPVVTHVISGAPYWTQSERVDISALLTLSAQLLQNYRPAMPQQNKTSSSGTSSYAAHPLEGKRNSPETANAFAFCPSSSLAKQGECYQQQRWMFDVEDNHTDIRSDSHLDQYSGRDSEHPPYRHQQRVLAMHTAPSRCERTPQQAVKDTPAFTGNPVVNTSIGVLILVGGHQYRVGAHRQFTLLSRTLAQAGFASLRLDVPGMGDNPGQLLPFYQHDIYIKTALDGWQQRQPQLQHFVIWGLCDAASSALIYQRSFQDDRLLGLVLLNPWLRQPQQQAQVMLQNYYGQKLTDRQWWLKLLRGQVHIRQSIREVVQTWWQSRTPSRVSAKDTGKHLSKHLSKPAIKPPVTADNYVQVMYEGWHSFAGKTLVLLSGADFTAQEFLLYCEQQPMWQALLRQAELHTLADANHTFARADWRAWVEQQTVAFLHQLNATVTAKG